MKSKKKYRLVLTEAELKLLGIQPTRSDNRYYLNREQLNLIGGKERYYKFRGGGGNSKKKPKQQGKDNDITWEQSNDGAFWKYEGYTSIRSLEQALEYCDADLDKWEVERYIFNSWDTTMKDVNGNPLTATNYQVKVWFTPKINLDIAKPKFRNIKVKSGKAQQMWVIIGCIHRPFHDKILWDKFLKFLEVEKENITGFIINGDYLDLRSMSSHEEWIPEGIDLSFEYSDGLQGINEIERRLHPRVKKIFHYGNHEDRFFRDKKSIRMYGGSLAAPHEALELKQRGWDIMTDWKNGYTTLGKNLDVFHGTKVGMNAAKDQLQALPRRDHIFNHTHRFGTYSNKTNTSYNTGCMIDFDADEFKYVDRGVRAAWSHGFAIAYIDEKMNSHVYPIKVDPDRGFFFKGVAY
jgi:predicted phosphodiesterase